MICNCGPSNCEYWFCREKSFCIIHQQAVQEKPTLQIFKETNNQSKKNKVKIIKKEKSIKNTIIKNDKSFGSLKRECVFCEAKENLTKDHILPRSRGGKDGWHNIQILCFKCNQIKGNKYPFTKDDYLKFLQQIIK